MESVTLGSGRTCATTLGTCKPLCTLHGYLPLKVSIASFRKAFFGHERGCMGRTEIVAHETSENSGNRPYNENKWTGNTEAGGAPQLAMATTARLSKRCGREAVFTVA